MPDEFSFPFMMSLNEDFVQNQKKGKSSKRKIYFFIGEFVILTNIPIKVNEGNRFEEFLNKECVSNWMGFNLFQFYHNWKLKFKFPI